MKSHPEDKTIFVDGKNQIPSFIITPNVDKGIIVIDLVESEWTSYEEMLSQNAIMLLRVNKYVVNRHLNENSIENIKHICIDTLERAIKLGFIYFNEHLRVIPENMQGKWSAWPRKY